MVSRKPKPEVLTFDSPTGLSVALVRDGYSVELHAEVSVEGRKDPPATITFRSFDDVFAVHDAVATLLNKPTWLPAGVGGVAQEKPTRPTRKPRRKPVKNNTIDPVQYTRVDELGLDYRTLSILNRNLGYECIVVADLIQFTPEELKKLPGFGPARLSKVRNALKVHGVRLQGDAWDG